MIDLATFLGVLVLLGFGAWWVATLDELVTGWMAGRPLGRVALQRPPCSSSNRMRPSARIF